jgi:phenylacetate-CoA ligase
MAVQEGPKMTNTEDVNQFLVGRIAFPAANYILNRKGILGRYRNLLLTEHASQDILRALQFRKLTAVLQHAYEHCPFYTRRFKEIGLAPQDIKTLEDIQRIPPLDRADVVQHRLDLVDARYRDSALVADQASQESGRPILLARFRKRCLVRNTSTGSTGSPTIFYEDGSTTALNWVHEERLKAWFGLKPGVKEARFKGISTSYGAGAGLRSCREFLWNQMMLPGFFLSTADYQFCLQKIRKFKPRVLWGPTPALAGLARQIRSTNQDISECRPSLVISWAAPLYDHEKKLLGEVFGCPVSNVYGTREVGHMAMNCPLGSTHVNQENYLVEIEGAGDGLGNSGPGQILVTPLNQSPMPFLRYRVGDLAEIGVGECSCGRSLQVLNRILGRTGEVFKLEDGRLIEPNFWCLMFIAGRPNRDVERFQVVYRRADCIRFRIVPRPSYSLATVTELQNFLARNFPTSMHFEFEYVTEIQPQPSGKYAFIINEIGQQEEHARSCETSAAGLKPIDSRV